MSKYPPLPRFTCAGFNEQVARKVGTLSQKDQECFWDHFDKYMSYIQTMFSHVELKYKHEKVYVYCMNIGRFNLGEFCDVEHYHSLFDPLHAFKTLKFTPNKLTPNRRLKAFIKGLFA